MPDKGKIVCSQPSFVIQKDAKLAAANILWQALIFIAAKDHEECIVFQELREVYVDDCTIIY